MSEIETERRTKRRYAHELYPHADECEVRPLAIEVPYLYARAIGFEVEGTGWFDHPGREAQDRTHHLIDARQIAFQADAMLQGLPSEEAWKWAAERACDESGEWAYERAAHYGVPCDDIKPYPCGPERDHHDHLGEPDARGSRIVTRAAGPESECLECTEPIEHDQITTEESK